MISTSKNSLRESLTQALQQCRFGTLKQFETVDETTLTAQPHPDFSPVGWHLGHIAYTEALWLLQHSARLSPIYPEYHQLFRADGLPKTERVNLPSLPTLLDYLKTVRTEVWRYLEIAELQQQERLWRFIIQHESQHSETVAIVLQLQKHLTSSSSPFSDSRRGGSSPGKINPSMIEIPAGSFEMGNNSIEAMDNEQPRYQQKVDRYWIDCYPVTCGQYRQFMAAGGYQNPKWWSTQGWNWLQQNPVNQPLYWVEDAIGENHPVCGVSWYEAEAYCNFVGKRLPTEAEWEKAASWDMQTQTKRTYPWGEAEPSQNWCNCCDGDWMQTTTPVNAYPNGKTADGVWDMLGNVWEWTASRFAGYSGFQFYPYEGYSQTYFDGKHRVLKGGSWATRPWAMRCSFRNWYHPGVRQIFAGFRCAKDIL